MGHKTSTATILAGTFLLLSILSLPVRAERPGCDDAMGERAENEVDYLKTWDQIYDSFKRYSACDDGAIAEGYSDAVVRYARRPVGTSFRLCRLSVDRDKRFGEFVFKHIDATTDDHDLDRVVANADRHCPEGDGELCSTIRRHAVAARSEQDKANRESRGEGSVAGILRFALNDTRAERTWEQNVVLDILRFLITGCRGHPLSKEA